MARYSSTRVSWQGDDEVKRRIAAYGRELKKAQREFANYWAPKLEEHAKLNRPWKDRSNAARSALRGYVDEPPGTYSGQDAKPELFDPNAVGDYPSAQQIAKDVVTIFLSHGMDYGKHLEEAWGGLYAIIMPTIEALLPEMRRNFQEIFG